MDADGAGFVCNALSNVFCDAWQCLAERHGTRVCHSAREAHRQTKLIISCDDQAAPAPSLKILDHRGRLFESAQEHPDTPYPTVYQTVETVSVL
jgi:hypothetical protein